jgi:hypothetical protein
MYDHKGIKVLSIVSHGVDMRRMLSSVLALALVAGWADAQSCRTLSGAPCNAPPKGSPIDYSDLKGGYGGGNSDMNAFSGSGTGLGNALSGNYAPTTFGAITFGGGGARCSGLFRSRNC